MLYYDKMHTRRSLRFLSVIAVLSLIFPVAYAADIQKKYIVLLADWGKDIVPREAAAAMAQYPEIRLAAAWPSAGKVPDGVRPLLQAGRVEAALALPDEPVFPLVFNTVISTAPALSFSWPDDLWNIVVRGQDEMKPVFPNGTPGIFLRSEAFNTGLVGGLKRLGIGWTDYRDETDRQGAFINDGFLLLAVQKEDIRDIDELKNFITQSSGPVVVASFSGKNPLPVSSMTALGEYIRQDPSLEMVTPSQLLKEHRDLLLPVETAQSDVSLWLRRPALLYQLSIARGAVEEYKNSGQAQPRVLDALNGELYNLYRFDFLARLNTDPSPEDEQMFLVGIRNVYMLLKRPVPTELIRISDELPSAGNVSELSVNVSTSSVTFVNASSAERQAGITALTVAIVDDTIVYSITLATTTPPQPVVDVYMDLNHQRGAGLAALLTGADGFMEPKDAWEYAFRLENGRVSLYRSGRFEPVPLKQFTVSKPLTVEIPRAVLRGNPLNWGYQAVLLTGGATTGKIEDFLCQDGDLRQRLLEQKPLQLPAVREKALP